MKLGSETDDQHRSETDSAEGIVRCTIQANSSKKNIFLMQIVQLRTQNQEMAKSCFTKQMGCRAPKRRIKIHFRNYMK